MKRSTRTRGVAALLTTASLFLATGCASVPEAATVSFYRATASPEFPRRVLILPFLDESGPTAGAETIEAVFTSELNKLARFDLVKAPAHEARAVASREVRLRGTYPLPALTGLAKSYRADAILLGSVTDHRPYPPLRLGLRIEMISTRTGQVLWSADALFDAEDRTTRRAISNYFDREIASSGSLLASDVLLVSMDKFTRFTCHEVVRTVDGTDGARKSPPPSPVRSEPRRPALATPEPESAEPAETTTPRPAEPREKGPGSRIGGCF